MTDDALITAVSAPWLALLIVIVTALVLDCPNRLPLRQLRPRRVMGKLPVCDGVPVMTPVLVFKVKPVGNVPTEISQVPTGPPVDVGV